jgi:hypothetical protein
MKAIRIPYIGVVPAVIACALTTVAGCALVACAAPPPWTAPTPPPGTNTLYWQPSVCIIGTTCKPFTYALFTNDTLVTASIPETATNYVVYPAPVGVVEYALAATNAAGRSACSVATVTNPAPPVVAAQPSTLKVNP